MLLPTIAINTVMIVMTLAELLFAAALGLGDIFIVDKDGGRC